MGNHLRGPSDVSAFLNELEWWIRRISASSSPSAAPAFTAVASTPITGVGATAILSGVVGPITVPSGHLVRLQADIHCLANGSELSSQLWTVGIKRGTGPTGPFSTTVSTYEVSGGYDSNTGDAAAHVPITVQDTPAAGTYYYALFGLNTSSAPTTSSASGSVLSQVI